MPRFRAIALATVCLGAVATPPVHAVSTSPLTVTGGNIAGVRADGMTAYLGIPFAAPPVGDLRWRAPQPVVPWKGTREARSFSAACAQTAVWMTLPKSEDCLYLNVWTPQTAPKLPVIVWIHGGGFFGGSAGQAGFNGANLARHGAVVVSFNYRLGVFGFFAHPDLTAESPERASGNQGMLDQIAALRWVQANIARFGGDPGRVTIVGQSAGGASVQVLVASRLAKGLFHRAIAQSGSYAVPIDADENSKHDRKTAEAEGLALAKAVGARTLAELRGKSVEALHKPAWTPHSVVDGFLLREDLSTTYRQGRQNDVPIMVGWNAEEGKDLAPEILGTGDFTAAKHLALLTKLLGHAPSAAVLAAYPGSTDTEAKTSINQLTSDWWGWRSVYWAALQAKYGRAKPYVYSFAHQPAEPATPCGYGCRAGHGAEIPYLFDNLHQDARAWTPADRQLADRLATTWVNFAATGNPNGKALPAWPVFDGSNGSILHIGQEAAVKRHRLPDFSLFPQIP